MIKRLKTYIRSASIGIFSLFAMCTDAPHDVVNVSSKPSIFPDYEGVTIPDNIAPLNFSVLGPGDISRVCVTVKGSKGGEMQVNGDFADFDIDEWHKITKENAGGKLIFSVCAKSDGKWLKFEDFEMQVSDTPLDDWGLTYRRVAPGYEVYSSMGIYQRCLSDFSESAIIENTLTSGQCYNCHTSARTNPDRFVFHIRGPHGGTMVQKDGKRTLLQAVNDSLKGAMVYPYWHPSGRFCAFSTNQTRQSFHIAHSKRLEVFDLSSDVLIYDVDNNEIILDSLLTTKEWSENVPVFSPDGKSLYFTTCLQQDYPLEYKNERYNLCRVGFDPATGKIEGKVDTIFDAVSMQKSVTWPRPSYDGRYLLFTLSDYGYFSVWHKESDQWLMDTQTLEAWRLDEANSNDADSYHNWSASSPWFVFTSRRGDGLYTRLYLSLVGADGKATKPFLLPQRNPKKYYEESMYSFNTPDFTSKKVEFDSRAAVDEIFSDERVKTNIK